MAIFQGPDFLSKHVFKYMDTYMSILLFSKFLSSDKGWTHNDKQLLLLFESGFTTFVIFFYRDPEKKDMKLIQLRLSVFSNLIRDALLYAKPKFSCFF